MAIFRTEDTKGKKEDLASFITMITRDETPFLSSIGNKKAKTEKTGDFDLVQKSHSRFS